eukprot:Gb_26351 [translate_table: standard]
MSMEVKNARGRVCISVEVRSTYSSRVLCAGEERDRVYMSMEKDSLSKLSGEAKMMSMSILKGIGEAHWAAVGLLVVSNILERFESISANNTECLQLLEAMNRLALHIKQLKDWTNMKEGIRDMIKKVVCMIV